MYVCLSVCVYVYMHVCQSKVNSSLTCIHGQVTKHTTVKWPIGFVGESLVNPVL